MMLATIANFFSSARDERYRRLWQWGTLFAAFFFAFTLMVISSSPEETKPLMRHAGVFFTHLGMVAFFLFAFLGVYILFLWKGAKLAHDSRTLAIVIFFACIFICILFLSPPFFSSDVYGYISRAVIANTHDANPYQISPAALGYSGVVAWPEQVSVYGPLFMNYSLLLSRLIGGDVVANLIGYRLVAAAAFLLCVWLVYKIAERVIPQSRYAVTALFAWNPFILFEAVHSAHNDVFMMTLVLAAVYAVIRTRYLWAATFLTGAFLIKFGPIILLPFVALLALRLPRRQAWRTIGLGALIVTGMVLATYAPLHNFDRNIGNLGRAFVTDNNLTLPQSMLYALMSWLDGVIPGFHFDLVTQRASYLLTFLVVYIMLLFRRSETLVDTFIKRWFWVLLVFLFLLGGKFNVWYTLWFVPLALLVPERHYRPLIILTTLYGFMYYASLSVFFPNVLFGVSVALYFLMVQWKTIMGKKWPGRVMPHSS